MDACLILKDCTSVADCIVILNKLIESWPVVYASKPDGKSELWSNNETTGHDTHRAFLAFIEEIKKEPCKHEPGAYQASLGETIRCCHCGVELQATWSEKKNV